MYNQSLSACNPILIVFIVDKKSMIRTKVDDN